MSKGKVLTSQDLCEMTAVPGGLIECARSQAAIALFERVAEYSKNFDLPSEAASPLSSPIRIDALNRSITITSEPLSRKHENEIINFKSTYTPLLQFLKTDAFAYEEIGNTSTTMFFDEGNNKLVAFCSTKCSSIKIKGNKLLSLCPSVEIAVLCVDDRFRYMGIGQAIMNHILQQIYRIRNLAGVQVVTLFAIPDAVAFYQNLNFRKIEKGMKIFYTPAHESCVPMYINLPRTDIDKR